MSTDCYFLFVPRDDSEALMAELRGDGMTPQTGAPLFRGELGVIDDGFRITQSAGLPQGVPSHLTPRPLPYPPHLKGRYAR